MKKKKLASISLSILIAITPLTSWTHSGRTDARGGHRDNRNVSGLGSYHYHCGGYPAHLHKNGICPYTSKTKTNKSSSNSRRELNKKIQSKLNQLGYNAGKADGIIGKNTRRAVRNFQRDYGLSVDGIPGRNTRKALGI